MLKHSLERDAGFKFAGVKLYVHDMSREEELKEGGRMGSLRRGKGLAVLITLMKPSATGPAHRRGKRWKSQWWHHDDTTTWRRVSLS
jgi:hypothetical protein